MPARSSRSGTSSGATSRASAGISSATAGAASGPVVQPATSRTYCGACSTAPRKPGRRRSDHLPGRAVLGLNDHVGRVGVQRRKLHPDFDVLEGQAELGILAVRQVGVEQVRRQTPFAAPGLERAHEGHVERACCKLYNFWQEPHHGTHSLKAGLCLISGAHRVISPGRRGQLHRPSRAFGRLRHLPDRFAGGTPRGLGPRRPGGGRDPRFSRHRHARTNDRRPDALMPPARHRPLRPDRRPVLHGGWP